MDTKITADSVRREFASREQDNFLTLTGNEYRALLAEIDRLLAVVEAARALEYAGWWTGCVMVSQDQWDALQARLAAYEQTKGAGSE